MVEDVEIKRASPGDAEILADISKRAFESDIEVGAPGSGGPPGYDSITVHRDDASKTWYDYWEVLYKDRIVGGLRVSKVSSRHGYIFGVFIDPQYHRLGIGGEFFRLIESEYPEYKKWSLDTPEWNVRTKSFYEKIGYVQLGILRWVPTFDLRYYVKIIDPDYQDELVKISDLIIGMKNVDVLGMIQSINEARTVKTKDGEEHRVADATLVDGDTTITLPLWDDVMRQAKEHELVRIQNGYVTEFRGKLQINLGRSSVLIILNR